MAGKSLPSIKYMAGLFDGEGSINIGRFRKKGKTDLYLRLVCSITNTFLPVLPYFQYLFGGNTIQFKKQSMLHKDKWMWSCSCAKAEKFLRAIFPYLIIKKREATIALAYRDYMSSHRGKNRKGKWYGSEHVAQIIDFKAQMEKGRTNRKNSRFFKVEVQQGDVKA